MEYNSVYQAERLRDCEEYHKTMLCSIRLFKICIT